MEIAEHLSGARSVLEVDARTTLSGANLEQSCIRYKLLRDIAARNRCDMSVTEVIDETVRAVHASFASFRVAYAVVDAEGWLEVVRSVQPPGMPDLTGWNGYLKTATKYLAALRSGAPLVVPDVRGDSRFEEIAPNMAAAGIGAVLDVPLRHSEQLIGLLRLNSCEEHEWTTHDLATLQDVADHLTIAIGEARAHDERRSAQQALERKVSELARSNAELQRFAYAASHDLKAPLRAIDQLSCWIMNDLSAAGSLRDETAGHMRLLRARVRRMESLLNDLLEYARVGQFEARLERVDAGSLVAEIVLLIQPPPGFRVEMQEPLPQLLTPKTALRQVLLNLVGNAIKHHDRPDGVVRVSAAERGAQYEFVVADDGPGIPPRFHDRVFELFQTLKPRDQVEGSGLGLAIVRKVIETYGGAVWIESPGERGIEFHFTWPKTVGETAPPAAVPAGLG